MSSAERRSKGASRQRGRDPVRGHLPCRNKRYFPRRKLAAGAASFAKNSTGEPIAYYHCPHCSGWHIGHPAGWRKEQGRAAFMEGWTDDPARADRTL